MIITKSQYFLLSSFFNDIAKGLFLGNAIGQVFAPEITLLERIGFSIAWTLITLLFLFLALLFTKKGNHE